MNAISSHFIWFPLVVARGEHGNRAPGITAVPFQFWLAWHRDYLFAHGREETAADAALDMVRAALA